ncbi:hypothetical protein [Streptomyces sp. NPDC101237]|uniref:hypothetical protein n=1 Tax=Streptomyces sp. NPDC101237 TaxID=3366139 RepID=UPI0038118D08
MTVTIREAEEDGTLLSGPLPYLRVEAVLHCLTIAKYETLAAKMHPYWEAAGLATPQEIRIPLGLLYAVRKQLGKWREADPTNSRYWDDSDDAVLTAAWRAGLPARPAA